MNILVIILLVLLFCNVVNGYNRGMVKSVISFVSLIILCIFVSLVGSVLQSYTQGKYLSLILAVLLLGVLGILHHLLGVVVLPAKLVSKLPVIHSGDKLLGIVFGALETVVITWVLFLINYYFNLGEIGIKITECTESNAVLTWLYEQNYLFYLTELLCGRLDEILANNPLKLSH